MYKLSCTKLGLELKKERKNFFFFFCAPWCSMEQTGYLGCFDHSCSQCKGGFIIIFFFFLLLSFLFFSFLFFFSIIIIIIRFF